MAIGDTSRLLSLHNDILGESSSLNTTVSVDDQVIVRIHEPGKQSFVDPRVAPP